MANIIDILIKAKDQTSGAFKSAEGSVKDLGEAGEKSGKGMQSFADNWAQAMTGINQTIAVIQQVAAAMKQVYATAREGAELEYLETRFDNLTTSIGTTADVLMSDLRAATGGIMSDAELMASATDMMALGLAKSHDEAVRLASVAGSLGMNMNQLVLTLTNQTTMRFDALGVSVDGFDAKVKQLEETGLSASEAFQEAFLQQAEEQIERVGSAVDTSIGTFMKMESAFKNMGDTVKMELKDAFMPFIKWTSKGFEELYDSVNLLQKAMGNGILTNRQMEDITRLVAAGYMDAADAAKLLEERQNDLDKTGDKLYGTWSPYGSMLDDATESTEDLADATDELQQEIMIAADAAAAAAFDYYDYIDTVRSGTGETLKFAEEQEKLKYQIVSGNAFGTLVDMASDFGDMQSEIIEKQNDLKELMAIGGGGYFDGVWMSAKEVSEAIGELTGDITDLETRMHEAAANMVFDMAMAGTDFTTATASEIVELFALADALGIATTESFGLVGDEVESALDEAGIKATGVVNDILIALGILDGSEAKVNIDVGVSGAGAPLLIRGLVPKPGETTQRMSEAAGGVVHAASGIAMQAPYLVGEVGPEPFFPAVDGRILSNSQAMSALRSGGRSAGNVTVVINTPVNMADSVWVERELAPYIDKAMREALRA